MRIVCQPALNRRRARAPRNGLSGTPLTLELSIEVTPGRVPGCVPGRVPGRVMVQEENVPITDGAPRLLTRRAPAQPPVL